MESHLTSLQTTEGEDVNADMVTTNMLHVKSETLVSDSSKNEGGEEMLMVDPSVVAGTAVTDNKSMVPVNVVLADGTVVSTINVNTLQNGAIDLQSLQNIALQNLVNTQILVTPSLGDINAAEQVEVGTENRAVSTPQLLVSDVRSLINSEASTSQNALSLPSISLPLHKVHMQKQSSKDERTSPRKHRGGWPKGKKRKPEKVTGTPKPPATGYLLYTIERRVKLKEENPFMTFAEQVKVMGREWSSLNEVDKQKYNDMAAEDRKRYITELQAYQENDTVQQYVVNTYKGENVPFVNGNSPKVSDNSLFCNICDVYFSNHHNKSEHMLGSKHLGKITKLYEEQKKKKEKECSDLNSSLNSDPGGDPEVVGSPSDLEGGEMCLKETEPLDVSGFMLNFIHKNQERDQELLHLRASVNQSELQSSELMKSYHDHKDLHEVLDEDLATLRTYGAALSTQIDALYMVPALFGVTKPFS